MSRFTDLFQKTEITEVEKTQNNSHIEDTAIENVKNDTESERTKVTSILGRIKKKK